MNGKVVGKVIVVIIVSIIMLVAGFVTFNVIYVQDENKNILKSFERASEKITSKYENVGNIRFEKISIE